MTSDKRLEKLIDEGLDGLIEYNVKPFIMARLLKAYNYGYSEGQKSVTLGCEPCSTGNWNEAYKNGYNDALNRLWGALRFAYDHDSSDVRLAPSIKSFVLSFPPEHLFWAVDRMKFLENRPEEIDIRPGDEIEAWDTNSIVRFIAVSNDGDQVNGFDENGGSYIYPTDMCRKTGRHYSITFASIGQKVEVYKDLTKEEITNG